ncbi:Mitochondrial import inner membrane translocase subunit tim22 [Malassezia sp. CBS 17886]|nr:Mitochondrial import inner membrane translocase subunit tim22 [Malassezia sp. CBS 17886]
MAAKMPLVAPLYLPGREPLPTGYTETDRAQLADMVKYQNYAHMAMESCVFKAGIAGAMGFGLGAFISLMSSSFAMDDPVRQSMMDRMAAERARKAEEDANAKGRSTAVPAKTAPGAAPTAASAPARVAAAPANATATAAAAETAHPTTTGGSILSKMRGSGAAQDLRMSPPPLPPVNTMQSTKEFFVQTGRGMWSSGRGFGKVGAMYSFIECCIEGYRAKNDIWNPVWGGGVTGGILARSSGPQAVVGGALAFAAFSGAIDW